MKPVLVSLAIATLVATPAQAGIKYMDRVRIIAWTQHNLRVEARQERSAHRERVEKRRAARVVVEPVPAPTPQTALAPTYSGGWSDELRAVGFPESAIGTMLAIIDRESGGNPLAINPSSGACGLTQIYPAQPGCLDAMTNLRMAYAKYQASGFAPWGG